MIQSLQNKWRNPEFQLMILLALGVAICLPMILLDGNPGKDTSRYYSAMIREISRGNFEGGYYPMIPPLFSTCGALFCKLGLHPFTAAQLTSSLFFVLTILPLFGIVSQAFGRSYAFSACLFFLICHRLIRYAGSGVIDTGKTFFLTLTVYLVLVIMKRWSIPALTYLGLAAAGLSLIRGEGLFLGGCALLLAIIVILRKECTSRSLGSTVLMVVVFLLAILPWVMYCHKKTGYPVTDSRQISFVKPVFEKLGIRSGSARLLKDPLEAMKTSQPKRKDGQSVSEVFSETLKGHHPAFLWLMIVGMILFHKRESWQSSHMLLIGASAFHTVFLVCLLMAVNADVNKRYIIATFPLSAGWISYGWMAVYNWTLKTYPNVPSLIWKGIIVVILLFSVGSGYKRMFSKTEERIRGQHLCGDWLQSKGEKMVPEGTQPLVSTRKNYHNGALPVILTSQPQIGLLGGCDIVPFRHSYCKTTDDLVKVCESKQVHFVVLTEETLAKIPQFPEQAGRAGFHKYYEAENLEKPHPYVIYGFTRNLAEKQPLVQEQTKNKGKDTL